MQSELQLSLDEAQASLSQCETTLRSTTARLNTCQTEKDKLNTDLGAMRATLQAREDQLADLRRQIADLREQLANQLVQVGDLTVLSKAATENMKETLSQLERKESYIMRLQNAKSKADSLNLALALNLTRVLKDGIDDEDVEVKVDKTVVYVSLSDKMLYQSGSANITPRADEVLGKIAQIVQSRPELEVMVEGHTDNVPISNACNKDNWDLSVHRATAVVRVLQDRYGVDPAQLVAAGRGEFNPLVSNDTADNRSINRRTRILLLPRLGQFYDLLNPSNVPQ
ncbi:MAG: OmpA family protein [Saprospiraceae bacterium]|nr:OmpA family protein [Saprospiraceae bacterium]